MSKIYIIKAEQSLLPKAVCMRTPLRQAVWNKTEGHCFYCRRELSPDSEGFHCGPHDSWTPKYPTMDIDHGTPKIRGGKDRLDNFYPSCSKCNSSKGKKTVEEYLNG